LEESSFLEETVFCESFVEDGETIWFGGTDFDGGGGRGEKEMAFVEELQDNVISVNEIEGVYGFSALLY
jgi:hypothetical protein